MKLEGIKLEEDKTNQNLGVKSYLLNKNSSLFIVMIIIDRMNKLLIMKNLFLMRFLRQISTGLRGSFQILLVSLKNWLF